MIAKILDMGPKTKTLRHDDQQLRHNVVQKFKMRDIPTKTKTRAPTAKT